MHPEGASERVGKTLPIALHEPIFLQQATDCFAPKPNGAKIVQLFLELSNRRCTPLLRVTEKLGAGGSHAAPIVTFLHQRGKGLLKLLKAFVDRPHCDSTRLSGGTLPAGCPTTTSYPAVTSPSGSTYTTRITCGGPWAAPPKEA